MQLTHYTSKFTKNTFPITIVCENVTNAPNIGGLFRTADAFGIEKIIFCGDNVRLGRKMAKTSRATEKVVAHEINKDALATIHKLKENGYHIVALEITTNSKPIQTFKNTSQKPIALIVGDENFGISKSLLDISDAIYHINMFGKNSSMNVVQAVTVGLYEITKTYDIN